MFPKIIYYYQTLTTLQPIITTNTVTHIHLSSIHFGIDNQKDPYIHLNNYSPYSERFDNVWQELFMATNHGIKVILMVGGAGGAFQDLFQDFETNFNLLANLIHNKSNIIKGVDLDIEEEVTLPDVIMLINRLLNDFGINFIISMAPIQSSLQSDTPGMGGFVYKDLYGSEVGKYIDYFNGQFYQDYSLAAYEAVVDNGYPENKVVMGMIMGQDFSTIQKELKKLYQEYGNNFGGVFIWEYYGAPPNWSLICKSILSKSLKKDSPTFRRS